MSVEKDAPAAKESAPSYKLKKNSTAKILLKRAQISKFKSSLPRREIVKYVPSIPETSRKHKESFPELPKLATRANSAMALTRPPKPVSKPDKAFEEIFNSLERFCPAFYKSEQVGIR